MHKKRKMCLTVAVIILGGSLWLGGCVKTEEKQTKAESEAAQTEIKESEEASLLNEAVQGKAEKIENIIDQYFLFEKDEEMMEEGIYAGIMAGLGDPYSVYYTREQYADLMESTTGAYCGIGALVSQDPNTGMVSAVRIFSGTPAEEAGMLPGDVIVAVDGMDVTGIDLDLLVSQYVKGEEGTLVVITVWRQSENEYLELDITRRVVEIPTVESRMLEDQIGYVAVSQFDQVTGKQFASEVEALEGQGMTSLIVDLRGNPGGTLDSVVEMMDYILPDHITNFSRGTDSTTLIYTENKNGDGDSYSANDGHSLDVPMAVLVNGNSASASEVFSGAMKDYGWATLVGTTTFGKGIVQSLFPLDDGTAVKLTVSNYYTPGGVNIHGTGIEPDVVVELDEGLSRQTSISPEEDNQLQAAIHVLKTGEGMVSRLEPTSAQSHFQTDGQPACSGMTHMDAEYASVTEAVFSALSELGYYAPYQVDMHSSESEEESGSRYHISQYQLEKNGEASSGSDLFSIDYDLGSGQIHSLALQISDRSLAETMAGCLVTALGEAAGMGPSEEELTELAGQLQALQEGNTLTVDTEAFSGQIALVGGVYVLSFHP